MTTTGEIVFYCRKCESIVAAERRENKYLYSCPICKSDRVGFGTKQSVSGFYRIREVKEDKI